MTGAARWASVWARAWPAADVEAVAALYAENALFYSHPFREPQVPREYVLWAFEQQAAADCRFGKPIVDGDRAAIEWWAVLTGKDGSEESIAGTSMLRFGTDGSVLEQRDVWAIEPGRRDLFDWAS